MKKMIVLCVLCTALIFGCVKQNRVQTVQVAQGLLEGVSNIDASVMVYKGVPYAAPPVGDLRWCPPQPPQSWEGVRVADTFSANPMQLMRDGMGPWTSEYQPKGEISEDCLYLNIWTPAGSSEEKLPVVMYIPGGGFRDGSGSVPVYDGENLAKQGLIVVTINYRVGIFGFYAHPELTQESEHHASGNYGLMDQVAALKWIQKNIAAFGGDPAQVTIMGQSAGAMSVHGLLASPLAQGLFVRAIPQSGSRVSQGPGQDLKSAEQAGLDFANDIGAETLADLRAMPAEKLHEFAYDHYTFRPIVDGWYLPASVDDIFSAGEQNDVATITGFVADEGSYGDNYGKEPVDVFKERVRNMAGDKADKLLQYYPTATQAENQESQMAFQRDMTVMSMYMWAKNRAKTSETNAYLYLFTHQQPGPTRALYYAFHSSELPYVFYNLNPSFRPWEALDTQLAKTVSGYWVNFIKTGDPNDDSLPEWPSFNDAPEKIMDLGEEVRARPIASPEKFKLLLEMLQ